MIAVIADDLSGAAELANAAVQAGFSAEVQLRFFDGSDADVVCLDTDTRSLPPEVAAARVEEAARAIAASRPALVYKKCDSVLRGNVAAESLAVARALGRKCVLLIPANPGRGRTIRGGEYFVDGIPLRQTSFAADPDFPRRSSHVADLLGRAAGIETPDAATAEDLSHHAATVDADTLPAGAVEFFSAVIRTRAARWQGTPSAFDQDWTAQKGSSLLVCGSKAALEAGLEQGWARRGLPVFLMPRGLCSGEAPEEIQAGWAAAVVAALRERGVALLSFGGGQPVEVTSDQLLLRLAHTVEIVLKGTAVARVFLEGGATAAAVIRQLGLGRFRAQSSPGDGVGALRPMGQDGPLFLIKPGSYAWPESVWRAFSTVENQRKV